VKYVIGSGWWCTHECSWRSERKRLGDDLIRTATFHALWYKAVDRFTDPCKILIVDSASPVRPPIREDDPRIEVISLDQNYGHSTSCQAKFCGYTRSCMMGVAYAWLCDADYFVYVEQDCLLYGEGLIEHAIERMRRKYMFGDGTGTLQPLQQSLFIIARSAFRSFLDAMDRIRETDGEVSPEVKFARLRWDLGPIASDRFGRLSAGGGGDGREASGMTIYLVGTAGRDPSIGSSPVSTFSTDREKKSRHTWREPVLICLQAARGTSRGHDGVKNILIVTFDFKPNPAGIAT
jgi:hypothetical protein